MPRLARAVLSSLLMLCATPLLADPECARPDRSAWMPESQFREQMKRQGVQITKFRITPGNCYEIYGFDKAGKKVEIYFDPATAAILETK